MMIISISPINSKKKEGEGVAVAKMLGKKLLVTLL